MVFKHEINAIIIIFGAIFFFYKIIESVCKLIPCISVLENM